MLEGSIWSGRGSTSTNNLQVQQQPSAVSSIMGTGNHYMGNGLATTFSPIVYQAFGPIPQNSSKEHLNDTFGKTGLNLA